MNELSLLLFLYKIVTLLCGVFIIFLGYKLFIKGIFTEAGDLKATWNEKSLLLKKAAPGTFFALFGAIIISISIYKGLEFTNASNSNQKESQQLNSKPILNDSIKLK